MPGGIDARKVSRSIDSLGRITPDPYKRLLAAPENCGRLVGNPEIGICGPDARCRQTRGSLALSMSSNPHGHRWIRSRWPPLYGRRNGRSEEHTSELQSRGHL